MYSDDEVRQKGARKRSLSVLGKPTSIAISDAMWAELRAVASRDRISANQLVSRIRSGSHGNLGLAIRLYIVNRRMEG
jgi:predicted DNA-binding ribbon-helix-helix protein